MKKSGNLFLSLLLISLSLFLTGCNVLPEYSSTDLKDSTYSSSASYADLINHQPVITLTKHETSEFSQVNASFYASKNKSDVFRVISNLSLSPQWFDRLKSIDTLIFQDNNNFVLRSVISSPWPFTDRELITCVNTQFLEIQTIITITNCSEKAPDTSNLVRVKHANSLWTITPIPPNPKLVSSKDLTKINYQAWLDPNGYVPAFFFNQSLESSSLKSLTALKKLIESD